MGMICLHDVDRQFNDWPGFRSHKGKNQMVIKSVRRTLLATTIIAGSLAATPAFAQDAPAAEEESGVIVVTGTLIRNPNLTSSSPVNVVGEDEIALRVPNNAEEILRQLPGVSPGIGTQVNNGSNGTNQLDLRGLGLQRNIVLLDGNRLVPSTANGAVDLNVIPIALVSRVDVLTGGASTTYGADAVSGVVNFITRKDFSGVDVRSSYKLTEEGDGQAFRSDITVGGNFDDGRGNAVLSIGYTDVSPVYQTRPFAEFGISSTNGRASGSSATSVPTAIALADGSFQQVSPDSATLLPQYQGFNFNPYNIFQTPLKRISAFASANYEVADNVEVYTRALFSQNRIKSIIAPSGIFGNTLNIPANNPYLNTAIRNQICAGNFAAQTSAAAAATNPVIAAALRADAARYSTQNCAAQTGSVAFEAPTATSSTTATGGTAGNSLLLAGVYRRLVELGPRISDYRSTIYDLRGGVKANLTDSIALDVNASYGRGELDQKQSGYVLNSRVQQALNASSTTACSVTTGGCVPVNIFGAAGSITQPMVNFLNGSSNITIITSLAQAQAVVSGDFGFTLPSASEPIGFAVGAEYRQYGYDRDPDARAQDPSELGGAGGATLPFNGGYDVKEVYGELIAPLVSDKPFFNELLLELGARQSSYKIDAPTSPSFDTFTWKAGLTWEPTDGIRLRGNYQKAVRAPNIGELFAPTTTGLTSLTVDPCQGSSVATLADGSANPNFRAGLVAGQNLRAVCLAQGAPTAVIDSTGGARSGIPNPVAGQANATGGGNVNLSPEKADTFTVGLVLTPRNVVPGLTVSVDYYSIIVNEAVSSPTPGDVTGACFGSLSASSATSVACTSIRRNATTGGLSGPSGVVKGLPTPLSNLGRLSTDGVDLKLNWKGEVANVGLMLDFNGNWTRSLKFKATPTSPNRDCVGYYSANCGPTLGQIQPEFSFQQRTTFSFGPASLSVLWRYMSSVEYEGQASDFAARGFTATNRNLFRGVITNQAPATSALAGQTVDFNRIRAYHYFDLNAQFDVMKQLQLTLGVSNLFNVAPPIVGAAAGTTSANSGNSFPSTYDSLGRSFSAAVRLKF
jgi:iron complex outermembrane recepter protein